MEHRLFVIGVVMGAFSWLLRRRDGKLGAGEAAAWHAAFWALAGLSAGLVLMMSFQDHPRYAVLAAIPIPVGELLPALAAAAVLGGLGFWHGKTQSKSVEDRGRLRHEDLEWSDTVFSAALMASLLMMFILQAFKIPSGSMEKTLLIGDQLFVNKFIYGLRVPFSGRRLLPLRGVQRGDILVFRFPTEDVAEIHCGTREYGNDLIKRVVGLPGETVAVRRGRVFIDGKPRGEEPYAQWTAVSRLPESLRAHGLSPEQYQQMWEDRVLENELYGVQRDYFGPVKVPAHSYFMMGDNRDASCDSRYWGAVPESYVKGKAWFIYWPPTRLGMVR